MFKHGPRNIVHKTYYIIKFVPAVIISAWVVRGPPFWGERLRTRNSGKLSFILKLMSRMSNKNLKGVRKPYVRVKMMYVSYEFVGYASYHIRLMNDIRWLWVGESRLQPAIWGIKMGCGCYDNKAPLSRIDRKDLRPLFQRHPVPSGNSIYNKNQTLNS